GVWHTSSNTIAGSRLPRSGGGTQIHSQQWTEKREENEAHRLPRTSTLTVPCTRFSQRPQHSPILPMPRAGSGNGCDIALIWNSTSIDPVEKKKKIIICKKIHKRRTEKQKWPYISG
ncbi:hypothetical protein AAFF_G00066110, partial [Aldrovandia affinis]